MLNLAGSLLAVLPGDRKVIERLELVYRDFEHVLPTIAGRQAPLIFASASGLEDAQS